MKTMNLKFMSMVAIAAMTLCTACSEDDNTPNPEPPVADAYSSELFLTAANNNAINYNFSNTFTNKFVGTIDGGADMTKVDNFFEAAAYRGAVPANNDWTDGWIRTSGNGDETSANAVEILKGELTANKTLLKDKVYALSGEYIVKTGATLTIQEGVKIVAKTDDESVDYILVQQGAKIEAVGTKENPIIMTSDKKESGAWGGLHICGKAHTNAENGEGTSEIGNAAYGGSADNDNSGTLKYIRLENTGYALDSEHEANGISFYGVGNGTTVEYVQAYNGSDDGFEFFGGSVDVKHMVVTNCSDDSFDWTEGWNGRGQFLVAYQEAKETLGFDCDCLMECDNNGKNFAATPVACPTLANLTLIGNGGEKQGVRLRAGTQVKMYNALITGKGKCLTTETTETEKALVDGTSVLNYVTLATDIECNGAEE
ncbi:hypothetical protein [Phocaeicola plebeius]|jgi:hypothetical protein|uniref:Lipoprotein n=1 Tax=Phocaeicola plebeius TaxID=310297 RepID=A0A415T3A1_9BACT|nr:hypothetical protein [Phocaeicola plebeius]MBS4809995.1 hypothetical protein [Bacteroides sp.]MBS4824452.1 hypothetical protein [Bacteroides sp.]RHM96005.1 hypothetical protein DWZ34_10140 [Phocaeicola plebeius]